MSTTVYIWNRGQSVGHCALEIKKGWGRHAYISFWPGDDSPTKKTAHILAGRPSTMPRSYQEECGEVFCHRRADHKINLCLPHESTADLRKLKAEYEKEKYNLALNNCCDIACKCLSILAGEQVFALTPNGLLKEVKKLEEKFR